MNTLQNNHVGCLLMPLKHGIPVFQTSEDKTSFNENKLIGWDYHPNATASEIVGHADQGKIFVPGRFVKCPDKLRYRHTKATWQGTTMICGDADEHRSETRPDRPDPFDDPAVLFCLYPALPGEAYAIGHSLSSLSHNKPHVRARIYFLTELEIKAFDDYKWLLSGLSVEYPMISTSRQPAQPVYGNAGKRRIITDGQVQTLPERFKTKIFDNTLSAQRVRELIELGKQAELDNTAQPERLPTPNDNDIPIEKQTTLIEWLQKHRIATYGGREHYLFIDCPWKSEHTSDFGKKDTAVWEFDGKFSFRCLHEHCSGRDWKAYRQAVAPTPDNTIRGQQRPVQSSAHRHFYRERYGYDRF